jgi:hypothetical protein
MYRKIDVLLFFIKTGFLIMITTAILNLFVNVGNGMSCWFFIAGLLFGIAYLSIYYANRLVTMSAFVIYLVEIIATGDEVVLRDLQKLFQQTKSEGRR